MTVLTQDEMSTELLAYHAPVNEKTTEIRKQFQVNDETGYPEHYSWRALARIGPEYRPEDLYRKLDPFDPKEEYATKITICGLSLVCGMLTHLYLAYNTRKPLWSGIPKLAGVTGLGAFAVLKLHDMMIRRQAIKNAIMVDYVTQHPERFETVKRYKYREILAPYYPRR